MEGHAAIAKCFLKLNQNDNAEIHLKKYLDHAEKLHLNNA
jgi:hypothetical protein